MLTKEEIESMRKDYQPGGAIYENDPLRRIGKFIKKTSEDYSAFKKAERRGTPVGTSFYTDKGKAKIAANRGALRTPDMTAVKRGMQIADATKPPYHVMSGQPKPGAKRGVPTIFDVPEKYQGRFGKKYLTNKGLPDYAELSKLRPKISSGSGKGVYGTPPTGRIAEANKAALFAAREELKPKRATLPRMDLTSYEGIIKAMSDIAPTAMNTGFENARLRREKAALGMGLDVEKIRKAVAETLAIPQSIATKKSQEALNVAKTETAGKERQNKLKATEMAFKTAPLDPLTGERDMKNFDDDYKKFYNKLSGNETTGGSVAPPFKQWIKEAQKANSGTDFDILKAFYESEFPGAVAE